MKDIGPLTILLALFCVGYGFGVPALHAETAAPPPEVTATGGVSAPLIAKDEDLRFWITIQNKTASDLSQIRLTQFPDGYQITEVCFFIPQPDPASPKQDKPCANTQQLDKRDVTMALAIPAGQNLTVGGRLKPSSAHKKETLTLVLEWTVTGKPSSSITVALGENQVQDFWEGLSSSWIYQLFKDLAVPISLLVIGFVLNSLAKSRENRQAAQQKSDLDQKELEKTALQEAKELSEKTLREAREKQEKDLLAVKEEQDKKRDARSETLKQMLPVSHAYAAKYYLPLSRSTERAVTALYEMTVHLETKAKTPASFDPAQLEVASQQSFFYVLMVKRILEGMRKEIGGLYFKDLRGEQLASACIKKFELSLGSETAPLSCAIQRLANLLKRTATYETFHSKFWSAGVTGPLSQEETDTKSAWALFEPWVMVDKNRQAALQYLSALTIVLDFEANRPYEYWYEVTGRLDLVRLDKLDSTGDYVNVEKTLRSVASGFTTQEIDSYVKG
jgi:hypothetical protein